MVHSSSYLDFSLTIERAQHLLKLYELLLDKRKRAGRDDWLHKFKNLMHWPKKENVVRIDSRAGVLVFREKAELDRDQFSHDYLSELLRYSLVAAVSSLDKYIHDLILENFWKKLNSKDCPSKLKEMKLPLQSTKSAIERIRKQQSSRPSNILKQKLQEQLHQRPLHDPKGVEFCANVLGVKKVWKRLEKYLKPRRTAEEIRSHLTRICKRRNQIVHEADLIRRIRHRKMKLRQITHKDINVDVNFIIQFVEAFESIIK
ncbi:MAG: HEPN domain-containing protein [Candidatus Omnitrophota bacterium]